MNKTFAFILLFLFLQNSFSADYISDTNYIKAYEHVLFFEFNKAENIIEAQIRNNDNNLLNHFLKSKLLFIEAFLSETEGSRKQFNDNFNITERKLKSGNKSSPYYLYCLGNIYLYKGLIAAKFNDNIQAGIELRKGFRTLNDNYSKFPNFIVQYKEVGLLHYMFSNVPEQYNWIMGLAGLTGSRALGSRLLNQSLQISLLNNDFKVFQLESLLYNAAIVFTLNKDKQNLNNLIAESNKIDNEYRRSPLYRFVRANAFKLLGNSTQSIAELRLYKPNENDFYFSIIDYMYGMLLLPTNPSLSRVYFLRFLKNFNGKHLIKSSYHKIAWSFLLEENIKKYEDYLLLARYNGSSLTEADKQANFEASKSIVPEVNLLKARLLSDNGDYDLALKLLLEIDTSSLCKTHIYCVEYFYRLARIYEQTSNLALASKLFSDVIEMGKNDKEYFAANSALLLGKIFEDRNDKVRAKYYYDFCLRLPNEEYRSSIQQKAKDGLKRIR